MSTRIKPVSVPVKTLKTAITSSASSFQLNDILEWDGTTNLASGDFGTYAWATFRNATNTRFEVMRIDPATIASTSITIVKRGLPLTGASADYDTEVSANKLDWNANETYVELGSNPPQLYDQFAGKHNEETITQKWTFTETERPELSADNDSTNDKQFISKGELTRTALGTLTNNRIIVEGNAGATVSAGQLVYLDTADTEWKLCDADTATTVENVIVGIAQGSGTDGNPVTGGVLLKGVDDNQTGLTANSVYYAGNTAGAIASSPGTVEVTIGVALSTTQLYFYPRFNQGITEDQQDALVGTSGTPSGTNKYVTNEDTATSGANKVLRLDSSGNLPALSGENLTNLVITNGRIRTSYVAGENITAGAAVVAHSLTTLINTTATANTGNPRVLNLTTTADNCWLVGVAGVDNTETISGLSNATQRGSYATSTQGVFFDSNGAKSPAGAYSMSVSGTYSSTGLLAAGIAIKPATGQSIAYVNVSETGANAASINLNHTTSGSNRIAIIALMDRGNGSHTVTYGGVAATASASLGYVQLFYIINPPTASTNVVATRSNNSSTFYMWVATYTGADQFTKLLYKANSTNNDYLANNFIGIAAETKTTGQTCLVDLLVSNQFTFLQPGATYYLSNTAGAISTSAGSQSRKIGLALSQTELLLKHDNV